MNSELRKPVLMAGGMMALFTLGALFGANDAETNELDFDSISGLVPAWTLWAIFLAITSLPRPKKGDFF